MEESKYVTRLFGEWKQHGKIIIAVDFDDTISPWKFTEDDINKTNIFQILKKCKELGCYIVCFTACDKSRFGEIKNKFNNIGLVLDSINENPIDLPYGNHNKIYANIFLDDRAGLEEALRILEISMWKYAGYINNKEISKLNEIG